MLDFPDYAHANPQFTVQTVNRRVIVARRPAAAIFAAVALVVGCGGGSSSNSAGSIPTATVRNYSIPADNPFAAGGGAPEIYAWGLRNPWRWSFDSLTGDLWLGDVGQGSWEEINIIEPGKNYGWRPCEGAHTRGTTASCNNPNFIDPIAEYDHSLRRCSITGGYVYRGTGIPTLNGTYLFGDLCTGTIWSLRAVSGETAEMDVAIDSGLSIVSFGQSTDGEIYVVDFRGTLHQIVEDPPGLALQPVFTDIPLASPVHMLQAPGDDTRWFVAQRNGGVVVFPNDEVVKADQASLFISIAVDTAGEGGLLGMAFHPDFPNTPEVFLSYTRTGPDVQHPLTSVISRFTSNDNGLTLDPESETEILVLNQPFTNHNGGHIVFGPDGFLYIGLGDGGSANDPFDNGQNVDSIFGALLRVDVATGS